MPPLAAQSGATKFTRPTAIRAGHRIRGIRAIAKHWHQNIEMRRVFDIDAGWIGRRLGDSLANRRLHLIWIRLRLGTIEI
jgi:hypothetical protein